MKTLFIACCFFFINCDISKVKKLNDFSENQSEKQRIESNVVPDDLSKYLPERKNGDTIIKHNFLVISYSRALKNPEWAVYKLDKERVLSQNNARRRNFGPDPALSKETANVWDYSESGYDRGHIVPAEDMDFSEQAMQESFYMSNVSPQIPTYNRGIWKKLENTVRKNANRNGNLIIISGTVFTDGELTEISNGVAVPSHFYKIILHEDGEKKSAIAFVLPHIESHSNLSDYAMSVTAAEKICGLNFFKQYGASTDFESVLNKEDWIIN